MCSGFIAGYKATNNIKYKETAERNIQFVLKVFRNQSADAALFHTYKNDITKYPAMLEDYASLITALIDLYEISGDIFYIEEAISLNHFVIDNFSDENDIQFYFTQKNQTDIPLRNKELYDHATPSGNALMLSNLIKISIITGDKALQERADKMFLSVKEDIIKYPSSFGMWLIGALQYTYPILETAICGVDALDLLEEVNRIYYPNRIIMIDTDGSKINYPLLNNKFIDDTSRIFNCRNYNCQIPVISIKEYIQQLKSF
ncbi:MAG: thioredoxin domain-containing protein [Fimbriimonadaceae bacterium]|nr:thioredoxin domain-containing protein [Chitinophagales bacterium]